MLLLAMAHMKKVCYCVKSMKVSVDGNKGSEVLVCRQRMFEVGFLAGLKEFPAANYFDEGEGMTVNGQREGYRDG